MKKLLIGGALLAVVAIGVYQYTYQDHRDIATEEAAYVLTVTDMHGQLVKDEAAANKNYLDQTIEVKGSITSLDTQTGTLVLDGKLNGSVLNLSESSAKVGDEVTVKGRFLGYDDLLEELKFDQLTIK